MVQKLFGFASWDDKSLRYHGSPVKCGRTLAACGVEEGCTLEVISCLENCQDSDGIVGGKGQRKAKSKKRSKKKRQRMKGKVKNLEGERVVEKTVLQSANSRDLKEEDFNVGEKAIKAAKQWPNTAVGKRSEMTPVAEKSPNDNDNATNRDDEKQLAQKKKENRVKKMKRPAKNLNGNQDRGRGSHCSDRPR